MGLDDVVQEGVEDAHRKAILSTLKDSGYSGTISDRTIFIYETIPQGCWVGLIRRIKGNHPIGMLTIDAPNKIWTFQAGPRYEPLKAILVPLAKEYQVHFQKRHF